MAVLAFAAMLALIQPPFALARSSVMDDPHFVGNRGVKFDFHGELNKSFCLIADKNLQVNAFLGGYKDKLNDGFSKPDAKGFIVRSWIKELGIIWRDSNSNKHVFLLTARPGGKVERGDGFLSQVVLDGDEQDLPYNGSKIERSGLSFFFTGTVHREHQWFETFHLDIDGMIDTSILMRPTVKENQKPNDAQVHFNVNFKYIQATPKIHGVLGQTYRNTELQTAKAVKYSLANVWMKKPVQADDPSGDDAGFLDGDVEDYETSGVDKTDCKFSTFS